MHRSSHNILLLLLFLCLASGCSSGPEKAVSIAAEALKNKDSEAFSTAVDIKSYLEIAMTEEKAAYRRAMGSILGSNLAEQAMRFANNILPQAQINDAVKGFKQTVDTGQISLLCQQSQNPDCPWVYESLRNAKVKEVGDNSAVASVDTPNGIRQWLAIRRYDDNWKIMAVCSTEGDAKYKASDERLAAIQNAVEKIKSIQIETYKQYEDRLNEHKNEQKRIENEKKEAIAKAQSILSNITFSDVKSSVTKEKKKYQNKDNFLFSMSTLVENKNDGKVSNYKIKVDLKVEDVIVDSFAFNPGNSSDLAAHQKYSKQWSIWVDSLTEDVANKVNDGSCLAVPSIEIAWFDGQIINPDGVGFGVLNSALAPLMKPDGYDEWKQQQGN